MEKLLKKLRKLLGKAGLEEEKIEAIVTEVQSEDEEPESEPVGEKEPEETSPAEPSEPVDLEPSEPTGEPSEPTEQEPVSEEGSPEPAEPSVEPEPTPEPVEPEPAVEPEVVPPAEPIEPEVDYKGMIEEQAKVIDGLSAKISALEDALRKADIMHDEVAPIGVDENSAPSNNPEIDFTDTLAKFNRH